MKHTQITSATLSWQDDTPVSDQFDDIYFNKDGGLDETHYVFLQGNNLQQRFAELTAPHFTIAETGFGTGLNFLCARQLWLEHCQPNQTLHFISVEKFPLSRQHLTKALEHWPQLADGAAQLIELYPPAFNGFHRLVFDGGRVQLTLMLGDSDDCFPALDATVDAWFLDGFAPAKNPSMWSETLFKAISKRSRANTTFATFTAAGIVKRGLQGAGFNVKKIKGFGRKREMLIGEFPTTEATNSPVISKPWFQRPALTPIISSRDKTRITVIGAGLAGCTTAWALAQRGFKVTVVEQHSEPAQAGSGNRQGALYAKPTLEMTKQARLHITGMLYSQQLLRQLDPDRQWWDDCGVLLAAPNQKTEQRFNQIAQAGHIPPEILQSLTAEQASAYCGLPIHSSALLFEEAGWVNPPALCQSLLAHPAIEIVTNYKVKEIGRSKEDQRWQLISDSGNREADIVIIAGAAEALQFRQTSDLPLKPIRGQVTHTDALNALPTLKTVVCAEGYISPPYEGQYCFGATFDIRDAVTELRASDVKRNLKTLSSALPELADHLAQHSLPGGRVSFRCATSDYLPIVGELPKETEFNQQYARLSRDARWPFDDTPPARYQGLFVNVGHGSKGLITCPLSAEILAALICQEPLPTDREVADALDPARFLVKKLIKQAI